MVRDQRGRPRCEAPSPQGCLALKEEKRIAICGYGRFGEALVELALEHEFIARAYDPSAKIAASLRVDSVAELCESAAVIILCLPIEYTEQALRSLRPHLSSRHLVLDVGSVKLEPVKALERVLGDEVDWVGTHPLFGPTSLARGDRPLRVVLCEGTDAAKQRARELWAALGCDSLEQSSEEHDRAMARSHALAFFLAKGLLEIRAGEGAAFTPPSFEAIGKTIAAVRSDAGHLFRSIQNRNPYAAEERQSLIEALTRIDEELTLPIAGPEPQAQADSILECSSSAEETPPELLADLDRELLALVARRARLAAKLTAKETAQADQAMVAAAGALGLDRLDVARWFKST